MGPGDQRGRQQRELTLELAITTAAVLLFVAGVSTKVGYTHLVAGQIATSLVR